MRPVHSPATANPGGTARNLIGGEWRTGPATPRATVRDPATGAPLGEVPLSGWPEVDAATQAAKAAFPAWRDTPLIERVRLLFRVKARLEEELESLARSLTLEHGKNLAESRGEIRRGIENIEHACGMPTLMMGETLEQIARGIDCETVRQPLGVFAGVTPYNFPVMIPCWFWPYAIATGNTFILKPSEKNPLTHQRVVEIVEAEGLPPGVLNVVHGGPEAVSAILEHPEIVGISFVGSSGVARQIYARAAGFGKRVQALGGAKNHLVILPDADLELSAAAALDSLFGSAGQRCLAGSVIVGVGDAYEPLRERFLDGASAIRMGHGLEEGVDMGPVISAEHRDRVLGYIDQGKRGTATLTLDRSREGVPDLPYGNWVGPTVFEGIPPDSILGREEIFGPVAALTRVKSVDEAIGLIHRSHYGNATSLFTTSGRAAREFRYRAGISMIGINVGVAAPMAFFPFGGSRTSFYGDLRAQGSDAVEFFTDRRVVISRW
jgi:malonate-semialdehyde dehydrogenase (acetylating) / methylmalonate-semialdehyde dehydrogenase